MCWQFLLQSEVYVFVVPVPPPARSSCVVLGGSVSYSICSVAVSGAALQSLDFFTAGRLCSCCTLLDERLVFEIFTNCPCSLSPGQDDGLVHTGTGRGTSKRLCEPVLRVRAGCVPPARCTGGERTCCSVVNPLLELHLSFSFVVPFSGMKPHFHYLKVHAQ